MPSLSPLRGALLAPVLAVLGTAPANEVVVVRRLEPVHALVLRMKGSHAQHDAAFARLAAEMRVQALVPNGAPFGRYFNDRSRVPESELLWEIGVPLASRPGGAPVSAAPPFEIAEIPGGETALLVHEGEYASSAAAWPVLLEWVAAHGYRPTGPAMQVYLGNPNLHGELGPSTELRLPVEKLSASSRTPSSTSGEDAALRRQQTLPGTWAASEDRRIVVHAQGSPDRVLTEGHQDFKPSWSPDGRTLTFFRLVAAGPEFKDWRTRICVVSADGTGLRELTSGAHADFNPTWTREGSRRVVFNRYSPGGGWHNRAYWISPDAAPGEEQLVSDPAYADYEWVTGALRDGRLVVDRVTPTSAETFLLRPALCRAGRYERLKRPSDQVWHKLSVSPNEKRVAYMLDFDRNAASYEDVVLCYADLDLGALAIRNPVAITRTDTHAIHEYPAWSRDEAVLYYDSNVLGRYQLFAYRLADGLTTRVSPRDDVDYQFVALFGLPR